MPNKKLQIIPLGGLGEFGMNCLALRWEDDIIVIDAGLMFPESELLGVDIVVPDITYLIENKKHVRAIVLTHGHEDHIGGLPWILNELKVPVYATEFTLAYVEDKLEEHQLLDETELIEIEPKTKFTIGPFTIEPIRVTHSLVDCVALAIETPVGVVIHTGDFKIDLAPLDDKAFDLHTLRRIRQAWRAGAPAGLDKRGAARLHAQRARRHSPTRRGLHADPEETVLQLLLVVNLSHPHCHGAGAQTWAQSGCGGPLHGRQHRDCAGPGIHRCAAGTHRSIPGRFAIIRPIR